jgi:hypothetical protein
MPGPLSIANRSSSGKRPYNPRQARLNREGVEARRAAPTAERSGRRQPVTRTGRESGSAKRQIWAAKLRIWGSEVRILCRRAWISERSPVVNTAPRRLRFASAGFHRRVAELGEVALDRAAAAIRAFIRRAALAGDDNQLLNSDLAVLVLRKIR